MRVLPTALLTAAMVLAFTSPALAQDVEPSVSVEPSPSVSVEPSPSVSVEPSPSVSVEPSPSASPTTTAPKPSRHHPDCSTGHHDGRPFVCYDRNHRLCVLSSPGDNDHRTVVVKVRHHDSDDSDDSDSGDDDSDSDSDSSSSSTVADVPNPVFTQWSAVPSGGVDTGSTV